MATPKSEYFEKEMILAIIYLSSATLEAKFKSENGKTQVRISAGLLPDLWVVEIANNVSMGISPDWKFEVTFVNTKELKKMCGVDGKAPGFITGVSMPDENPKGEKKRKYVGFFVTEGYVPSCMGRLIRWRKQKAKEEKEDAEDLAIIEEDSPSAET